MSSGKYIIGGVSAGWRKLLSIISVAIGIICFLTRIILIRYYYANRPLEPMPSEGLVYSMKESKWNWVPDVYVTKEEYWLLCGLLFSCLFMFLFVVAINLRWKRSSRSKGN